MGVASMVGGKDDMYVSQMLESRPQLMLLSQKTVQRKLARLYAVVDGHAAWQAEIRRMRPWQLAKALSCSDRVIDRLYYVNEQGSKVKKTLYYWLTQTRVKFDREYPDFDEWQAGLGVQWEYRVTVV